MDRTKLGILKQTFLEGFQGFKTFLESGKKYFDEEDAYKRSASKRMRSLFDPWVSAEVSSVPGQDLKNRIETVLSRKLDDMNVIPNLTNWRDNQYILGTLLGNENELLEFRERLHVLLQAAQGEASIESPMNGLLDFLRRNKCPANISKVLPTLFYFIGTRNASFLLSPQFLTISSSS